MENQKLQIIQRILILCFCFLALVVVGGISLYFYLSNSKPETIVDEPKPIQAGLADSTSLLPDYCNLYTEMPDISFQDVDGNEVKLSDFRGKTLVVTFWASWCPDCHQQFEHIQDYQKIVSSREDAVYILLDKLDNEKETKEQAVQYLNDRKIDMPLYFDNDLQAYAMLGMHNVPTTFFIDPQGIIRAWSATQITEESVFEALFYNCVYGSEVMTQQFVKTGMTDDEGGIHSSYNPDSLKESLSSAVLSESQGAMLEYALLMEDQSLFEQTWSYIQSYMWNDGMIAWQSIDQKPDKVNALIDDFRIYRSLIEANDKWGGYDTAIDAYQINIMKYGIKKDHYIDFYDFKNKESANRFTLCYGDLQAMKLLAEINPEYQMAYDNTRTIIKEGFISYDFPLYYSWYNYKKQSYERTDLNTSEAMVTLLHLAESGELSSITVDWIKKNLYGDGIKARYDIDGNVVSGYGYESTAVYALVAMIGKEIGDDEITGKALKKMEKMRINDMSLQYNGAFGNEDGSGITSFDQLMPMLAYAYQNSF